MMKSSQGNRGEVRLSLYFFICKYTHKSNKNENYFHFMRKIFLIYIIK